MKVSLRIQFLFPMLLAVFATALGVTYFSKWYADRFTRQSTIERLSSTGKLCANAKYPLTSNVLTQIQELSQLRLAIIALDGSESTTTKNLPRVEITSRDFPQDLPQESLVKLCVRARTSKQLFYEPVNAASGQPWNASAFRLVPNPPQNLTRRFLILLESTDQANRASVQAFVLPLVTGLCSSIAIALVAILIAGRIGHRIERLEQHVETIADGSFESITPRGPIDSIHSLYQSVNSMSQQLRQSSMQIAQNERSRLINLIASGLAHELRNRLTGARLAIQTCAHDPSTQEALAIAQKQMQLAEETVQRLLALRVDSTSSTSPPLTLAQVESSVLDLTQSIAQHQRVSFDVTGLSINAPDAKQQSQGVAVQDGNAIVGALINLVLNAFEAAGPGGVVELRSNVVHEGDRAFLEWKVRDNGPGPSPEIEQSMFEPFATTKREGVGLGLAMSKRIAQRQQGDLRWTRDGDWTEFAMRVRFDITG